MAILKIETDTDDPVVMRHIGAMFTGIANDRGESLEEHQVETDKDAIAEMLARREADAEALTGRRPEAALLAKNLESCGIDKDTVEVTDIQGDETPGGVTHPNVVIGEGEVVVVRPNVVIGDETPGGVVVDPRGIPWDARIHSKSKTRLSKSNEWKYKRGLSEQFIATVETELLAAMAVPAPSPAKGPAPPPDKQKSVFPEAKEWNFPEFMSACTAAKLSQEDIEASAKEVGLESAALAFNRPDLLPAMAKFLDLA